MLTKNDAPLFFSSSKHTILGFNFGIYREWADCWFSSEAVKRFCDQICPTIHFVDQPLNFDQVKQI